mgnify:CR=1 FL=1
MFHCLHSVSTLCPPYAGAAFIPDTLDAKIANLTTYETVLLERRIICSLGLWGNGHIFVRLCVVGWTGGMWWQGNRCVHHARTVNFHVFLLRTPQVERRARLSEDLDPWSEGATWSGNYSLSPRSRSIAASSPHRVEVSPTSSDSPPPYDLGDRVFPASSVSDTQNPKQTLPQASAT